jgi:hypothetical protein
MEMVDSVFYKKNVPYRVGVRDNLKDNEGTILDDDNPIYEVRKEDLRAFVQANKYGIGNGLIIEIPEPPLEIITPNSISDEQALDLVKNFHLLKKKLPEITSEATISKLLSIAKASGRKEGTINLIMERYEEVSPKAMQGVIQ